MIQVIHRAYRVLEALSKQGELSMGEIAHVINVHLTTTCNIVKTLVDLGMLERSPRGYRIGPSIVTLANADTRKNSLLGIARETARQLAAEIKESVAVSMLYRAEKINLVKLQYDREVIANEEVYAQSSLYNTADGRLLLAYADSSTLESVLAKHSLPDNSWDEARTKKSLLAALAAIRQVGFSLRSSAASEVVGLAVPVTDASGVTVAAVSTHLPKTRVNEANQKYLLASLRRAAADLSRVLTIAQKSIEGT